MKNEEQPQQFSQSQKAPEVRIFTMPESYRHGKQSTKLVEPQKKMPVTSQPNPTPPPLPPVMPLSAKPHTKKQTHKALMLSGVLVLLALSIVGYLLVRSLQTQTPTTEPAPSQPAKPLTTPIPTSTPEPAPEPEPETETQSPFETVIRSGIDADSDGLTDLEENLLYQTNPNLPDSDADGFLDGNEVFHRYNPNGNAPGTLVDAGVVVLFERAEVQISYPLFWQTSKISEFTDRFIATTGEHIDLKVTGSVSDTLPESRITEWITQQGGQEQVVKTFSKQGYDLYLNQDKLHALLILGNDLLEFTYELNTKSTIDYLQTFQMIINSVEDTTEE